MIEIVGRDKGRFIHCENKSGCNIVKIMRTGDERNKAKHLDENKYSGLKLDKEFEINRPHNAGRLYNFLINYKF